MYQGHRTFQNQPPLTFFNKPFEDPTDALFLCLNEIDPVYLQDEYVQSTNWQQSNILQDPRTKQPVKNVLYDHTIKKKPELFPFNRSSKLSHFEHKIGVRIAKALQQRRELPESDTLLYRKIHGKWLAEQLEVQKAIQEYAATHTEAIYARAKVLDDLYKKYYVVWAEKQLQSEEHLAAYNTHCGLPAVNTCKANTVVTQTAEIIEVVLMGRHGSVPVWQAENFEHQRMRHNLQILADKFNANVRQQPADSKADFIQHLQATSELDRLCIPLESLLLLLTIGEYLDLPTEVMLEVEEMGVDEPKTVHFQKPFEARHCGWHTNRRVMQQVFAAHLSNSTATQWVRVQGSSVSPEKECTASEEVNGVTDKVLTYRIYEFENYLQECTTHCSEPVGEIKQGKAVVKWHLNDAENNDRLEILTSLDLPPALSKDGSEFLSSFSLKLEYKSNVGCEVMTKYELLHHWLQCRLLSGNHSDTYGVCLRISTDSFAMQLEEQLTLDQIEQQLMENYHVNVQHMLHKLHQLLKLILKMSAGKYLLRFNPKYNNTLLLCAPSREKAQSTILPQELLKTHPSDLQFMTQEQYLPIAARLCSIVHEQNHVLPCAFPPKVGGSINVRKPKRMVNDRVQILKRIEMITKHKEAKKKAVQSLARKQSKRRKRIAKTAAKKAVQKEEAELAKDMEHDKLLYGFK